jgi:DtxR family Mn-dependent transcriptional regulator
MPEGKVPILWIRKPKGTPLDSMAEKEEECNMINPKIEEILEDLYLQSQDPSRIPRPMETDTLQEAVAAGYITVSGAGPLMTAEGTELGTSVVRRHRLAECLLCDVFQLPNVESAEEDACAFEHMLRPGLEDRVCTLLGHPPTCPHGRPIPRGDCCKRAERDQVREVGPLCDGRAGQNGVVAYLSTRDNREVQKLMAMGILPGSDIRLIRLFPSYIFAIGHSQFTVDRSLAEKIFVHWHT